MLNSIRTFALVSFTFLAALFLAGCAASAERTRSDSNTQPKPLITPQVTAARPKIVAFGDSLTAGFGLTERESYPFLLQQQLNADGYNYEVVNAGVSGDTSLGGLERIDWVLDDRCPDTRAWSSVRTTCLRGVPPRKDEGKSGPDHRQSKGEERRSAALWNARTADNGVPNISVRSQVAFPDLATKHKVAYLPFVLENVALHKELNQADSIHPNAEGEKIMTANVYQALKPLLQKGV